MAKTKYVDLDDIEKIGKQWRKLSGLRSREDWSAAIVRAATAAEIAANYAIRQEFHQRSKFDSAFVNKLLRWANGIEGKLTRLLVPLHSGGKHEKTITMLKVFTEEINTKRNQIVHSGHFMNKQEAKETIDHAKTFVETLVRIYRPEFELLDPES